jgi:hypothetical protein
VHAVIFRPYQYKIANIINIICESVLSLVSILIFGFIEEKNDGLQWAVIIFIIVGFMTNILLLLYKFIIEITNHNNSIRNKSIKIADEAQGLKEVQSSQMETTKNHNIPNKGVQDSLRALESPSSSLRLSNEPPSRQNTIQKYSDISRS